MLIIERLGDVQRAIEFAKEQKDEDLWEDLLSYSESRPGEYLFHPLVPFCVMSIHGVLVDCEKSKKKELIRTRLYPSTTRTCRIRDQPYPPNSSYQGRSRDTRLKTSCDEDPPNE